MAVLRIQRIGPGATIQDLGRPGYMHHGVPPGGPLVPELFEAANRSLGNAPNDAALEVPLSSALLVAEDDCVVSVNGEPHELLTGQSLQTPGGDEAVHYIAVQGGFDVPLVLGSRGTLLAAKLGGLEGRMLRAGDRLSGRSGRPVGPPEACAPAPVTPTAPIRVVPGPDALAPAAVEAFFSQAFRLSPLVDRVGQRLDGFRLPEPPRDRSGSMPMVRGAIQVTTDGTPIVLGPDHPTTGGYPVIGVVISADLGALARRRPGYEVRFTRAPADEPRTGPQ